MEETLSEGEGAGSPLLGKDTADFAQAVFRKHKIRQVIAKEW